MNSTIDTNSSFRQHYQCVKNKKNELQLAIIFFPYREISRKQFMEIKLCYHFTFVGIWSGKLMHGCCVLNVIQISCKFSEKLGKQIHELQIYFDKYRTHHHMEIY